MTTGSCLLRPSSALEAQPRPPFFVVFEAVPGGGFEILGLLIYTNETNPIRLKITGVFGDLRGKMCTEKRGGRNAVRTQSGDDEIRTDGHGHICARMGVGQLGMRM